MSEIGQPIEIFLTHEERDTVVAALRFWQAGTQGDVTALDKLLSIPGLKDRGGDKSKWGGLDIRGINSLCDRLGDGI